MSGNRFGKRARAARGAFAAASILFFSGGAHAQGAVDVQVADKATAAQALFEDAERLLAQHRFDEACAKLRVSKELDPAAGTLLNLARCYERAGRIGTAWSTYTEAMALAQHTGRTDWVALSARRLAALDPRVSRILVRGASARAEVTRNGTPIAPSEIGVAIAVDSGTVRLEAREVGKRPWRREVSLAEGELVEIEIGPLDDEPHAIAETPSASASSADPPARLDVPEASRAQPESNAPGRLPSIAALGAAGLGVVGVGIGAGFGIAALEDRNTAASICPQRSACSADAARAANDARREAPISTTAFVAGGALLGVAAVLFFTAPRGDAKRRESVATGLRIGVGPGSVACEGAF